MGLAGIGRVTETKGSNSHHVRGVVALTSFDFVYLFEGTIQFLQMYSFIFCSSRVEKKTPIIGLNSVIM